MKLAFLLLFIPLLALSQELPEDSYRINIIQSKVDQKRTYLEKGAALSGKIHTMVRQKNPLYPNSEEKLRVCTVALKIVDHAELSGTVYRGQLQIAPEFTAPKVVKGPNWISITQEEIVREGRKRVSEVTFPGPGTTHSATVKGNMVYNYREDSYQADDLKIEYIDPETSQRVVDYVSGFVSLQSAEKDLKVYQTEWIIRDAKVDSDDTPFLGRLHGSIIVRKTKEGISEATYSIDGANVTTAQVTNFAKWWMLCVAPLQGEP